MKSLIKEYTCIKLAGSLFALWLFMAASPLAAQEKQRTSPSAEQQNIHTEQQWTQEAFNARMSEAGVYPNWVGSDSLLSREAFNTGFFNQWDTDNDGYITEDEYVAGSVAWGEEYTDDFDAWDVDEDGQLDDAEFGTGMDDTGLYDTWDVGGEGYLTEEEFGEGLFDTLDADDDGYLTEDEVGEGDYGNWFESDVEGGGTGSDLDPTGGTGTDIDGGTDIDTGTDTDMGTDIETGTETGTGTDIESGGATGTDTGGGTGTEGDIG